MPTRTNCRPLCTEVRFGSPVRDCCAAFVIHILATISLVRANRAARRRLRRSGRRAGFARVPHDD